MIIKGNSHSDNRGKIHFINDFDLTRVVRMYCIHPEKGCIRAWQGHYKETKWFFVAKGEFLIKTVDMKSGAYNSYSMNECKSEVLEIPSGYYNGFQAVEDKSVLIVLSDFTLADSVKDDFRKTIKELSW